MILYNNERVSSVFYDRSIRPFAAVLANIKYYNIFMPIYDAYNYIYNNDM